MYPDSWGGCKVTILDEVLGDSTLTFCFEKGGEFYRIMGATCRNGFFSDEIHKNNNKTYAQLEKKNDY